MTRCDLCQAGKRGRRPVEGSQAWAAVAQLRIDAEPYVCPPCADALVVAALAHVMAMGPRAGDHVVDDTTGVVLRVDAREHRRPQRGAGLAVERVRLSRARPSARDRRTAVRSWWTNLATLWGRYRPAIASDWSTP